MATDRIETLLDEQRRFPPPKDFQAQAHVRDVTPYERARRDPEGYWADWAKQLEWSRPWDRVLDWKPPHAKWFVGGKLNASVNCLDRHVRAGKGARVALIWEGEPPGETRRISYDELHREVNKFANVLKGLGVKRGDRVAIYLPMVPEVAVAMLACARIGAVHTVVFGGFSAESLRDRINDAGAKLLITADGGYRRGAIVPLTTGPRLGLYEFIQQALLSGAAYGPGVYAQKSEAEIVNLVASRVDAIGCVSRGFVDRRVRALAVSPAKGLPYVTLTRESLMLKTYPLLRGLSLCARGKNPPSAATDFVNFVTSVDGQQIVSRFDYAPATVSVRVVRTAEEAQ